MPSHSRTTKTIILSLGKALASVSGLVATMVLVRLFSKADFATYRQTLLVFAMVGPLLGLGLSQSVVYFIPTATKKRQGAIIAEAFVPLVLAGLSYYFFIVLGGSHIAAHVWNNPRLEYTLIIVAPIAALSLAHGVLAPSLIATQKVLMAAVLGVIGGISVAAVSTIVTVFIPDLEITLFCRLLVHCFMFLLGIVVLLRNFSYEKPTLSGLTKQLAFGLPLCLSSSATVISKNLDRAMVSSLCSLEEFAIFDRGAFELPLVAVVTGSMTTVLLVDYRSLLEEGRKDEILRLLHRSVEKSSLFLMPAMCFLFAFAPEVVICMFGEAYSESATVFRIYLLLLPNRTIVFSSIALAAGKTKELATTSVCALSANLILSYIGISLFGYVGGAVSTLVSVYFVSALLRAIIAKNILDSSLAKFLPITMIVRSIALSLIPLVPVLSAMLFFEDSSPFARLVVGLSLYSIGLLIVYWKVGHISLEQLERYWSRMTN